MISPLKSKSRGFTMSKWAMFRLYDQRLLIFRSTPNVMSTSLPKRFGSSLTSGVSQPPGRLSDCETPSSPYKPVPGVARICARAIDCKERDLYEIDAASNNSVDGIRALTEGVYTLPFESPYKVYILDEAHMLSKSAWNAFLKTLEEPPSHAVFILATTELEKVPETVQSRCQVFEFKKPTRAI